MIIGNLTQSDAIFILIPYVIREAIIFRGIAGAFIASFLFRMLVAYVTSKGFCLRHRLVFMHVISLEFLSSFYLRQQVYTWLFSPC